MSARRFEFSEGGSNKFWEIEPNETELHIRWGKLGTAGQSQVKSFADEAAATKEHDKLVAEKTKKGYREIGDAPSAPVAPAQPASAKPAKAAAAKAEMAAPAAIPAAATDTATSDVQLTTRHSFKTFQLDGLALEGDVAYWCARDRGDEIIAAGLDGNVRWSRAVDVRVTRVHATEDLVIVEGFTSPDDLCTILWLDRQSGEERARVGLPQTSWSVQVESALFVLLRDEIFVDAPTGGRAYVPRATQPEMVRIPAPGAAPETIALAGKTYPLAKCGHVVLANQHVIRSVVAYDVSGKIAWSHPGVLLGASETHAAMDDGGALVLVTAAGQVCWRVANAIEEQTYPSAGLGHGVVVLTEKRDAELRCFELSSGALRWTTRLELPKRGYLPSAVPLVTPRCVLRPGAGDRAVAYALDDGRVLSELKDRTERGFDTGARVSRGEDPIVVVAHHGESGSAMRMIGLSGRKAAAGKDTTKKGTTKKGATKKASIGGSLDLAGRLGAYFALLALRSDVQIAERVVTGPDAGQAFDPRVPEDVRKFAAAHQRFTFTWVLADEDADSASVERASLGGRFSFRADDLGQFHEADWAEDRENPFSLFTGIDDVVAEGNGWLVLKDESGPAIMGFENSNDDAFTPLGSFEDYVTAGAKRAFEWYWQSNAESDHAERLLDNSVPAGTAAAELEALLIERGAEPAMAHALVAWLGDGVRILLERS